MQRPLAETHRAKGAELLATGNHEERYYAACLLGTEPFDVDRALRAGMMPDMKRVVLAALASRYPEHAAPLNAMARKLNYNVSFPHYVLAEALAAPEPAPEPVEAAVTSTS